MALTTLQGVIDGLRPAEPLIKPGSGTSTTVPIFGETPWYNTGGWPGGAAVATPGMAGATLTSPVQGQIRLDDPGANETVIAMLRAVTRANTSGVINGLFLIDRLWHNSGIGMTLTTAQTVNSVAWPARDINQSTDGRGVYIAAEVSATAGTGTPTLLMSYTNSDGVSGRTGTNISATGASPSQGRFYQMGLQAGDVGVRSVQSITLSSTWTSGSIALVAFRPIAFIPVQVSLNNAPGRQVTVNDVLSLAAPRVWAGSVLQTVHAVNGMTGSPSLSGLIRLSQG